MKTIPQNLFSNFIGLNSFLFLLDLIFPWFINILTTIYFSEDTQVVLWGSKNYMVSLFFLYLRKFEYV